MVEQDFQSSVRDLQSRINTIRKDIASLEVEINESSSMSPEYFVKLQDLRMQLGYLTTKLNEMERYVRGKSYQYAPVPARVPHNIRIPESVPIRPIIPAHDRGNLERNIGKNIMGVLASLLIFIGLCSIGFIVLSSASIFIQCSILYLVSFAILGAGFWRVRVKRNTFAMTLSSTGIGAVYISIILSTILGLFSVEVMGLLLGVWSCAALVLAYKYKSSLYTVISYIGFYGSTMLGLFYYSDMPMLTCLLLTMQFLFNCFVTSNKYFVSTEFKNIFSYVLLLSVESSLVIYLVCIDRWQLWAVPTVLVLIVYLVYTNMAFFRRGVNDCLFFWHLSLSLGMYHTGVGILDYVTDSSYTSAILCFAALLLLVAYVGMLVMKMYDKGAWMTSFYYIIPINIMVLLFDIQSITPMYLDFISVVVFLLYFLHLHFRNPHFLRVVTLMYFLTLGSLSTYNISVSSAVYIISVLLFTGVWGILILKRMLKGYTLFDKLCLMGGVAFGLSNLIQYVRYFTAIGHTDFIIILEVLYLVGFYGLFSCSGYGTNWSDLISLVKKRIDYKPDISFYILRAISYVLFYSAIGDLYFIEEITFISILPVVKLLFFAFVNTPYMLDRQKRYSGYIIGGKASLIVMVLLVVFTNIEFSNLIYSLSLLGVAIACILFGFYKLIKSFRLYGLILSMLTVLKLVFLDIGYDSSLSRAFGYIFGGMLCLVIVYLYNKLESKLDS